MTLWIVQNVLLVASSALRTLDYVDAYSMTVLRLSALIWMALVATGLMLILWRLLAGRSSAWLVNANALAAAIVLTGCTLVDLRATAAAWNVDMAIRRHTPLADLDLCYLDTLGPPRSCRLPGWSRRPAIPPRATPSPRSAGRRSGRSPRNRAVHAAGHGAAPAASPASRR